MKGLNSIKNHFWIILLPGILSSCGVRDNTKDDGQLYAGTFSFTHELKLPGNPVQIYDACTGEVSDWWDHSFSEKPFSIYLDARVGGPFFETFDTLGNGALYATVTYADRGRVLRFEGPMGLSGQAILFVHTYTFQASGADSTRMTL